MSDLCALEDKLQFNKLFTSNKECRSMADTGREIKIKITDPVAYNS